MISKRIYKYYGTHQQRSVGYQVRLYVLMGSKCTVKAFKTYKMYKTTRAQARLEEEALNDAHASAEVTTCFEIGTKLYSKILDNHEH